MSYVVTCYNANTRCAARQYVYYGPMVIKKKGEPFFISGFGKSMIPNYFREDTQDYQDHKLEQ